MEQNQSRMFETKSSSLSMKQKIDLLKIIEEYGSCQKQVGQKLIEDCSYQEFKEVQSRRNELNDKIFNFIISL